MNEIVSEPSGEKPPKGQLFEHLFPGNSWERLPVFDPLSGPISVKRLFWDIDTRNKAFGDAVESGKGFAIRIELPVVDRLLVGLELLDTVSTSERPKSGDLTDMLNVGERIGGMGAKEVEWFSANSNNPLAEVMVGSKSPYKSAQGKIVGVLDQVGRPSALILYREGPRSKRRVKETKPQPVLGQLAPQRVRI